MRKVAVIFIFLIVLTVSPSVHKVGSFIDVEGFFVGVYTGGDGDDYIDHYTVPPQLYYNILMVFEKGAPVYRVDPNTGNLIYLGNFTQLYNHDISKIQVYESKSGTGPLSADSIRIGHDSNGTYYEHFVMFEDLWGGGDMDREDIYAKIRYYPELGKIWYIIRTHIGYAGYKKRLFFYTNGIIIDMGSDDINPDLSNNEVDMSYHGDDNANYGPFFWHHCSVITDPYSGKSDTWCGNEINGEFGLIAPPSAVWQPVVAVIESSSLKWFLIPRSLEANRTDIEGIINSTFPLSLPPNYIISGFDDVEPDDDLLDEEYDASQPISVEQYGYYTVYRGTALINTEAGRRSSWQRLHTDYLMEVQGEIIKNGKRHIKVRIEGHDNPGPDYKRGTPDDKNFEYYIMFYNIVTGEYTDWVGPIRNNSWWGFLEVKKP